MTEQAFNKAKEILHKIEHIKKLKLFTYHNPMIKESTDKSDHMYLSWADNENEDLKKIILTWLDEEEKRLMTEFNNL